MEILPRSDNVDARNCNFSHFGGHQINNYNNNYHLSLFGSGYTSRHHDLSTSNDELSRLTADSAVARPQSTAYHSTADAVFAIDMAVALIAQISNSLTDPTDSSNNHRDLLLILKTLHQILHLVKHAIKIYHHRPLGQSLSDAIIPEVERCRMVLFELLDKVHGTWMVWSRIRDVWRQVFRRRWDGDELFPLNKRLHRSRDSLGVFLMALNSVAWIELGNELSAGHVAFKKFRDLLQPHLSSLHHIRVDMVQVVDHLGRILPVPILFCSKWKEFHYIINGYSKGRPGSRFIERGDYEVLRPEDSQIVSRSEFIKVVETGMILEMCIIKRQNMAFRNQNDRCPRCGYVNLNVTPINRWIECRNCPGQFQVAILDNIAEEEIKNVGENSDGQNSDSQNGDGRSGEGETGEEREKERSKEKNIDLDHQEIISPTSQPTGSNTRQRADNENSEPPDSDGTEYFRRIHIICTDVRFLFGRSHENSPMAGIVDNNTDPTTSDHTSFPAAIPDDETKNHFRETITDNRGRQLLQDLDAANAQTPWYLCPTYDVKEILIDPDGTVKGGTVAALVERLTAHERADPVFFETFLMTYKSFTNLDNLFDLLVKRFWIQPPRNLNLRELEKWRKLKQHIIQLRVINTFKSMIMGGHVLEEEDMYILDHVKEFISGEEVPKSAAVKQLLVLIDRTQRCGNIEIKITASATLLPDPPRPIKPKNNKKLKPLDVDPLELARQLTILESRLYQSIRPMECLRRSRKQQTGNDIIAAVIQTSNRIANWVADSVLVEELPSLRAAVVRHFIRVADQCRELNNFSSMFAIISGLNSPPIRNLKRTWERISTLYLNQLGACERTIDWNKNFTNYRTTLAKISPPCVPFIGVFLTTLASVQDRSKDVLPGNLINFRKCQKISEIIQDIQRWQSHPYNFHPLANVLRYIEESLHRFSKQADIGDHFWNRSLEREPREREDEKIQQSLKESGLL